jgi:GntR family transcriptional regulator / MocR family aminotransferase
MLEQLTLAHFIDSGAFELHIHKMQKVYQKKRNHLISCLKSFFGDRVYIFGAAAGLHFACSFSGVKFESNLLQEIQQSGIEISSIDKHILDFTSNEEYENVLIFGYGNTPIEKMENNNQSNFKEMRDMICQ